MIKKIVAISILFWVGVSLGAAKTVPTLEETKKHIGLPGSTVAIEKFLRNERPGLEIGQLLSRVVYDAKINDIKLILDSPQFTKVPLRGEEGVKKAFETALESSQDRNREVIKLFLQYPRTSELLEGMTPSELKHLFGLIIVHLGFSINQLQMNYMGEKRMSFSQESQVIKNLRQSAMEKFLLI